MSRQLGHADEPVCLYAILPDVPLEALPMLGLDAQRHLYTLRTKAGLQAIVSRVRAERFNQAALEAGLQDPAWIETHVRAHQGVLDYLVATKQPVLPMRFCTIYRDEAAVQDILAQHAEPLVAELERLRDKQEWGIKLLVDTEGLRAAIRRAPDDQAIEVLQARIAKMSAGGAFLWKKKLDTLVVQKAESMAFTIADLSLSRLSHHASETVTNALPPQRPEVQLNAAYLVEGVKFNDFRRELERLGEKYGTMGIRYELSGPWPAYNFIKLQLDN